MAALVRLVSAQFLGYAEEPFAGEIRRLAVNLAMQNEFANPYICQTGFSTHTAPLYPWLLSLIFRVIPEGLMREQALVVLASACTGIAYALLPWWCACFKWRSRIGTVSGFLGAGLPLYAFTEARGQWEAPLVAAAMLLMTGIAAGWIHHSPTWTGAVIWGSLSGISFYLAPQLLPPFLILLLLMVWRWRYQALPLILSAGMAFLTVSPWLVRNYVHFSRFIFVRGNLGLELAVAYSPISSPTFAGMNIATATKPSGWTYHPCDQPKECLLVQQMGEANYFDWKKKQAFNWIQQNPEEFTSLTLKHIYYFWFPAFPSLLKNVLSSLITLAGMLAILQQARQNAFRSILLLSVMLSFSFIYTWTIADNRYRYPIYPMHLALGTILAADLVSRRGRAKAND